MTLSLKMESEIVFKEILEVADDIEDRGRKTSAGRTIERKEMTDRSSAAGHKVLKSVTWSPSSAISEQGNEAGMDSIDPIFKAKCKNIFNTDIVTAKFNNTDGNDIESTAHFLYQPRPMTSSPCEAEPLVRYKYKTLSGSSTLYGKRNSHNKTEKEYRDLKETIAKLQKKQDDLQRLKQGTHVDVTMNLGTAVTREQSSRIRLQRESSRPDLRKCFSPQRYPVRLCRSAQQHRQFVSSSNHTSNRIGTILIPSAPLSSAAQSERGGSMGTVTPNSRRRSSVGRAPVPTLGETISQMSAVEVQQARFLARHHSGRYSHAGIEDEYLSVKKRWREGADVSGVTTNTNPPSVRSHWHRPDSVWRTFRTSQQIQLYPEFQCELKGTRFELYRKCLRQLKHHRLRAEKRQSLTDVKF